MFLETSAKTALNVEEAFNTSAQNILTNIEKNKTNVEENVNYINLERYKSDSYIKKDRKKQRL